MDRNRFDTLTRMIAARRSRRGALAVLLGAALFDNHPPVLADLDTGKGKGQPANRVEGRKTGKGQGREDAECTKKCEKYIDPKTSESEFCCKGGFCSCGGKCCQECLEELVIPPDGDVQVASAFCCKAPMVVCPNPDGTTVNCCKGSCNDCDEAGPGAITGSYRRR